MCMRLSLMFLLLFYVYKIIIMKIFDYDRMFSGVPTLPRSYCLGSRPVIFKMAVTLVSDRRLPNARTITFDIPVT